MLWKNFGVTRHGKVVFYDYDEIEYVERLQLPQRCPSRAPRRRRCPARVWYTSARATSSRDLRPLPARRRVREVFAKHHADLLDVAFWQGHKERIQAGHVHDVFYDQDKRFRRHRQSAAEAAEAGI